MCLGGPDSGRRSTPPNTAARSASLASRPAWDATFFGELGAMGAMMSSGLSNLLVLAAATAAL